MYLRFMITLVMQLQSRCQQCLSNKTILERVVKKEILAVELLSDFGKHTHLSETAEEKLKRFILIFVYGIYAVMYVLIFYL